MAEDGKYHYYKLEKTSTKSPDKQRYFDALLNEVLRQLRENRKAGENGTCWLTTNQVYSKIRKQLISAKERDALAAKKEEAGATLATKKDDPYENARRNVSNLCRECKERWDGKEKGPFLLYRRYCVMYIIP
jgi:hypothetical protein